MHGNRKAQNSECEDSAGNLVLGILFFLFIVAMGQFLENTNPPHYTSNQGQPTASLEKEQYD